MSTVTTSILILSDTHGMTFGPDWVKPSRKVDVAIHCGDITQESKLDEFMTGITLLKDIDASLKLVIAGNHEITLDTPVFQKHLTASGLQDDAEVEKQYGYLGQARQLLEEAESVGIKFLDEGTHVFTLNNGASLTVYASPYTRRRESGALGADEAGWAYQYDRASSSSNSSSHKYDIRSGTDIVLTHGPPLGALDQAQGRRAGCPDLFASVARARPLLHCFGHIHPGWGAKLVAWRDQPSETPSHFTDIDNNQSVVIEKLANLRRGKFDEEDVAVEKSKRLESYRGQGFRSASSSPRPIKGRQTMFVNAAVEGSEEIPVQPPIVVDIDLPRLAE